MIAKPRPYQHIIWDWNGTLFDDVQLCVDIMSDMLATRQLPPLTLQQYREIFDFPVIDYYRRLGFDFEREPFAAISTEFITVYHRRRTACTLRPGAVCTLQRLRDLGYTQSVLSARQQWALHADLAFFQLDGYFSSIAGLDDHHAQGKVEVGRRLVAELALDPRTILLVGDTSHDYEVAQALGVDCCLVSGGHQSRTRLVVGTALVISSLEELLDLAN